LASKIIFHLPYFPINNCFSHFFYFSNYKKICIVMTWLSFSSSVVQFSSYISLCSIQQKNFNTQKKVHKSKVREKNLNFKFFFSFFEVWNKKETERKKKRSRLKLNVKNLHLLNFHANYLCAHQMRLKEDWIENSLWRQSIMEGEIVGDFRVS
jgi:hypothetical protein